MRAGSKARRIRAKSSTETAPTRLASEEQYRSLIEHAPDAIVVLDLATDRFVMVNPQAERIFGMSREQLLATGPVAVSPPFQPDGRPSPEAGREYIERAIAGETPTFEWVHRRSDGTDFPCDIRLLRLPAEDRILIRGSILDVSDRKHAEARLLALEAERVELSALAASSEENARLVEEARAAERRLREVHTLLNAVAHGMADVLAVKDLHGRYILGNETLVRTLGLRELDDVIGKTDREVLPHDVELVTGADREVMATGRAKQYEQTLHLPGGPRTLLATKSPLKDEDGNTLGVIVIGTDITDRKLVEEELRVERDRHAAFLAAMQDGFFATDLAARLTQANARFCEIVGYSSEEVIGVLPPYPWWPAPSDPEFARAITAVEHVIAVGHGEFDTAVRHRDGHQVPVILNVASLRDAQGNVVGYVGTMKEVTERRQADEARARLFAAEAKARRRADRASNRARALAAAAAALAGASTPAEVAAIILEHALGSLEAQGAGMAVPDPTGAYLELVATAGLTGEVYAHQVRLPIDGPYALCEAFRSGRPVRIASRAEWEQRYVVGAEIFAGKADAVVTLPLIGTGGPIGAVGLLFEHERTFTDDELATLGTFAQQGAQALERAGLYELEHEARARVERLQRVTALLSASLTSSQIADVVIEEALAAVGANAGVVALISEDGARFDTVRAVGPAVEALRFVPSFPANAHSPIADAVRRRRPVILRSYDEGETRYPEFPWPQAADREGALVALPMVVERHALGGLALGFPPSQVLMDEDVALLEALAGQCAQALERARLYEAQREVASTLQHSLLLLEIPSAGRLQISARYRSAMQGVEIGGDWFEVVSLPSGRLGIAVGDVVGRGLEAATTMGRLRSALRALALTGAGPVEVLTGLDVFAATTPGATMATLLYGEVDEVARTFRYSCAGHCPPLVVELGGSSRYLEDGRSVPLGIPDFEFERIEATAELPAGSTLLLYSDGLIERRGEPLDAGLRRLAGAAVESKAGDAEELADELLTAMLEGQSQTDDVALLCVVFPRGPTTPFVRRLPARPEELSELRRAMRTWLEEAGVDASVTADLVLACGEAAANSIEHAYRNGDGVVDVEIAIASGPAVVVSVRDRGTWRTEGAAEGRGRGIPLIGALVDEVELHPDEGGTIVTMRRLLTGEGRP